MLFVSLPVSGLMTFYLILLFAIKPSQKTIQVRFSVISLPTPIHPYLLPRLILFNLFSISTQSPCLEHRTKFYLITNICIHIRISMSYLVIRGQLYSVKEKKNIRKLKRRQQKQYIHKTKLTLITKPQWRQYPKGHVILFFFFNAACLFYSIVTFHNALENNLEYHITSHKKMKILHSC